MSKQSSKELFEWYADVAHKNIEKLGVKTYKECKRRIEFEDFMLNIFIKYYGLRCTCDDAQDWDFINASGHYNKCELWKFCHIVKRCLDWQEERFKQILEKHGKCKPNCCAFVDAPRGNCWKEILKGVSSDSSQE